MNMDQALQAFIDESCELLEVMENALLGIEHAGEKTEMVNAIFRAAHTIKGSAGLFGLDHIVEFTHVVESVLDRVRDNTVDIEGKLVALLLACRDHMGMLIGALDADPANPDPSLLQQGKQYVASLRVYLGQASDEKILQVTLPNADPADFQRIQSPDNSIDNWHISLRFGPDVLKNGMDPMSFLRYLQTIGSIVGIVTVTDGLPSPDAMDPEQCYLGYEIAFKSSADKATIENVFEFVRDDSTIRILPPNSKVSEYVRLIQDAPTENARLGELLVKCGTVTARELEAALEVQAKSNPAQQLGKILIEKGYAQSAVVDAALAKQEQVKESKIQESRTVRVDADKLDHLINLVGELIIAGASANLIARRTQNTELQECSSKLSTLVGEVRDSALQLRMVKIGATFNRFQRVVHDVSREIGKDIELSVSGEETELDKTVVEKIGDPLTHLVRNAIDHGIEATDIRLARGKPAKGLVKLNAFHESGYIVIEVSDDGGGLRRDRILEKAIERGLIEPNRSLTDQEVFNLIFEPGFSTAEQITNLSGRGVGMDVVKKNITALRGTVEVDSIEGTGTTVTVRLPLTLAIINGFLVEVGKSIYAIPLDMVEECVEYAAEAGHDYTNLRGEILPFVKLGELFGIAKSSNRRENIVVVKHAGQSAGLVVDTLLGEFQTVIKPLSKMFNQVKCVSGSTILGSGDVALILDVPSLVEIAVSKEMLVLAG